MNTRAYGLVFLLYVTSAAPTAAADTCKFLSGKIARGEIAPLQNGKLVALGRSGWQDFGSLSDIQTVFPADIEFAYVIDSTPDPDRAGVLAIKTNRPTVQVDPDELRKKVILQRRGIVRDLGCEKVGEPDTTTSVSTDAYRDYHDYDPRASTALRAKQPGESRSANDAIYAFHFEYKSARKRKCLRTDSKEYDDFPSDWNNNRRQFSFDRTVVASGSYSVARLFFWIPESPFEQASDNRVTVKKYKATDGWACVHFTLPIASPNYTFRVNDLESRDPASSNSRKQETRWSR